MYVKYLFYICIVDSQNSLSFICCCFYYLCRKDIKKKCYDNKLIRRLKIMLRYIVFFISVFLFSCSQTVDKNSIDKLFSSCDTLKYTALSTGGHLWGKPFSMKYIDSMLFVYDDIAGENIFHLIDLNHGNKVYGLGRKGQGSNEYIMPMEYLPCGDTAIAVFDYANKKLSVLSIDDFLNKRNEPVVCYKDTFPGTIKLFHTKYNSELSFGFYDDCMFYLQKNNKILQKIGFFPYRDSQEKQIENRLRGLAYQGILQNNPSNDKFVYAVNNAEIVYFYHIDSLAVNKVCEYQYNYPQYRPMHKGETRAAPVSVDNIRAFMDATASDNFVYLLYSGKTYKEDGLKSFEGNIIYVFDWMGRACRKIILDLPVFRFCVDKEDKAIYAFSNNPDPVLVRFSLP